MIKFLLLLLNFVLYVLPLVLCMYSTYFTLYSAHDVYSAAEVEEGVTARRGRMRHAFSIISDHYSRISGRQAVS